jgi:hypothetical protein
MSARLPEWVHEIQFLSGDPGVPQWVRDCARLMWRSMSAEQAVDGLRRLLVVAEMRLAAETPEPARREDTAADGTVTRVGQKPDGSENKHTSGGWGTYGKFTT